MGTVDKDFKVKNGLQVAEGATFGGPVSIGAPTLAGHAVTKAYADALAFGGGGTSSGILVSDTPPAAATDGVGWYNSTSGRLYLYYGASWIEISAGFGENNETAPATLPPTPDLNDQISIGDRTWQWDGTVWQSLDLKNKLSVLPSQEGEDAPKTMFFGTGAPDQAAVQAGDLWTDTDDDAGATEFIFTGPDAPDNYDQNTLWIDTDDPDLPLIYSDNEPPTYDPTEGDFWVDLDDLAGQLVVTSEAEPDPEDANLWIDLSSEAGYLKYQDLFSDNASQIASVNDLPDALNYQGMIAYVSSEQALYVASGSSWIKIFPNYDAEALVWMDL